MTATARTSVIRAAAALAAVVAMTAAGRTAEVDVYLLGGQSNMQGVGRLADLPADVPRQPADTFFWNGRDFEPLVVGTTKTAGQPGEFGPEVGFATGLPPVTNRPRYLVKHSASGMPLHHGWNGTAWVGDTPGPKRRNFHPGERADDPNQGMLYREMIARFQAAIAALHDRGDVPVVRGFLWMQGEQDAKHERSATDYPTSLRRLRDRVAEDLGLDSLPLAFGQVLPHEPALPRYTNRREIRAAMAAADGLAGGPEAIPDARMVSTDGCSVLPDTVHYDAAGQLALGRAFAETMRSLSPGPDR